MTSGDKKVDQANTMDLGRMIGIPTIGVKRVSCVKFGYRLGGFDLDETSTLFKQKHCKTCKARRARDESCIWSFEWEKDKAREYERLSLNNGSKCC